METRKDRARYSLPLVVDPTAKKCFSVMVPDDVYHIAAFKGQIEKLAHWWSWALDDDHTARDAAAVWRGIFDNLTECSDVPVMFQQPIPCLLQASFNGGVTWETIYDGTACVTEGIQDALNDGTLGGPQQPPPIGQGEQGQCYTYHVSLGAKDRWHSPIPVQENDTITVTNAKGAWTDGAVGILSVWNCPDGNIFALGACGGSPTTIGTDPAPSLSHMKVIAYVDSESPAYFEVLDTTYTVSSATPTPHELFIQANDDPLTDNDGSITFTVTICKGSSGAWCHEFDFSLGMEGWTFGSSSHYANKGTLTGGKMTSVMDGTETSVLQIVYDFGAADVNLTEIDVEYDTPYNRNGALREIDRVQGGVETFSAAISTGVYDGWEEFTFASTPFRKVIILIATTRPGGTSGDFFNHICKVRFKGNGVNPFGESNCV